MSRWKINAQKKLTPNRASCSNTTTCCVNIALPEMDRDASDR